jgi:N-acetylmuramoyl-L-alanine amidase
MRMLRFLTGFVMIGIATSLTLPAQELGRSSLIREAQNRQSAKARGDSAAPQEEKPSAGDAGVASGKARLSAVRFVSSGSYTRVTLLLSREARFESGRLIEDAAKGLPPRIYVDVFGARLAMDANEPIKVNDGVLRQIRVGQFTAEVVRVVLDLTSLRSHQIFLLPDPQRLVIDIQGRSAAETTVPVTPARTVLPPTEAAKGSPPKIRKIVLDPGHGGKDPGAIGVDGLAEKDVVLNVAKKLARKLQRDLGVATVLTRRTDAFVPLETRTAIANAEDADLFISLHMNASPNGEARGLETYYLDNTTDEASIRLASRENATSRKNVSDLQFILSDMAQNLKLEDSITLAHRLHGSMVNGMSRKMPELRDLGVKKALFYVLVGARMPSVLVEMFFITNRAEARAMSQESYQEAVVDALFEGIQQYHQSTLASKTL